MFNPFPGLRPFEADEEHLFFGREQEIDELLRRLRSSRLVAVVGTSGSGKSSLVRSGLIPSLQSGFMAGTGSSWRIATFRPGENPIGHLASALSDPEVLGGDTDLGDTARVVIEVTLRRGTLGLVEAVQQARLPEGENVLVLVDQFEELFRFRDSVQIANSRDEAVAFVRLLLEAAARPAPPIHVVLTMRSDFIGDCMNFPGLPEAVNEGLYLVGRMPRERLRTAITGPVAVAGGAIAPRLVHRILNDLGDDHDQLPLVQHALSRTWAHWAGVRGGADQIDIEDYEAVGTMRHALSTHAEEAYDEAAAQGLATITERVFKALTDTVTDARGTRRPTSVAGLAAIAEASEQDVVRVVEIFRASGRCFLMPPASTPLEAGSIVDLSHESLMRCWGRLISWAEEERAAATFYARLSQAAAWFEEGTAGLWRNPELVLAERWRATTEPSAAWAARYDAGFDRAIAFLDRSLAERDRLARAAEVERRAKLRRTQLVAGVLALLLLVSTVLGVLAVRERDRAAENLALARRAVDQSLAVVDRDAAKIGADLPQVMALRRELLARAKAFSDEFIARDPGNRESRRELALAHLRLGHIDRMLDRADQAEQQYGLAISQLSALVSETGDAADRQFLASAYNWLGETLRGQAGRAVPAAAAYDGALELQSALAAANPSVEAYQQELGRTLYNRGILRADTGQPRGAEDDFREAIRRLEPLTGETARQDLGRAYNNLAALFEMQGRGEARAYYERAIDTYKRLVADHPANMEYQGELALLSNNLAYRLHALGETAEALIHSQLAVDLLTTLAQPPPSVAIDRADAHSLRGTILEAQSAARATEAYAEALRHFENLAAAPAAITIPNFHVRFGELLVNLATLAKGRSAGERSRQLLSRGLDDYSRVATKIARSGSAGEIREVLATVESVRSNLDDAESRRLLALEEDLRRALRERGAPQEGSRL